MSALDLAFDSPGLGALAPSAAARPGGLAGGARMPGAPHNRSDSSADGSVSTPMAGPATSFLPGLPLTVRESEFETTVSPLWLKAQAGDDAAYRDALRAIASRVRGYLRRRLDSTPDEVEDLVQDVLLALHLQRGTWNPATPVEAWVLAIARYKLVDLWRRRGRQEALHDPIDDVAESALVAPQADATAGRDLARLLESLPAAQREAIVLTKVEGLSVSEACARTGASESALKVQVHRGLKRLAALVRQPA